MLFTKHHHEMIPFRLFLKEAASGYFRHVRCMLPLIFSRSSQLHRGPGADD